MVEKFSMSELSALRIQLIEGGLDSIQAAEVLQMFLMGHGYGVSPDAALDAVSRVGGSGCSLEAIEKELNSLALVQ